MRISSRYRPSARAKLPRSECSTLTGSVLWQLYSLSSCTPSVTRSTQVVSTQTMCQPSNKKKMVLSNVSFRSVFPCFSISQELVLRSSRLRKRTLESSLARKHFVSSSHSSWEFLSSSFQDFISGKLTRISRDQMMRLKQIIGNSLRRRCQVFISSYHGCGTCPHFLLIS